jgi:hypothetical protein
MRGLVAGGWWRVAALGMLCGAIPASELPAQGRIRRSQEAWVRQKIADTWIDVHYRRPVARGRILFGGIVEWGRIWSPSADSAATFAISTPIQVEGQTLPRGHYSIWVLPDSAGPWTVVFSKADPVFHLPYPGESQDQLRVQVTPTQGQPMEALAFYFPTADGPDGLFALHWGTTVLTLRLHAGP